MILQLASWLMLLAWQPAVPASAAQKQVTKSPHGPLAVACENCHTATAWKPIRAVPEFDHNKTRYPLRGMHEKVQCVQCHVKPVFTDVGKQCQDCHDDVHQRKMGTNCAECHTVLGWNIAVAQVKEHQNRFPLVGAHAAVQCDDCHKGAAVGQFQGLSTACSSCHLTEYNKTTSPNHSLSPTLFPLASCGTCHSFDSWLGAQFNHSTTGFVLEGTHATIPCSSCHINNNYNLTITQNDCGNAQCHLTNWQQTTNPPHPVAAAQAGNYFSLANCYRCHDTVSWTNYYFNHDNTGFSLYSSHKMVPYGKVTLCSQCHVNNNYTLTTQITDCVSCHQTDYNNTATLGGSIPNHVAANFPAVFCSSCHDVVSFLDNGFDHAKMSAISTGVAFPLTGKHQFAPAGYISACTDCHGNPPSWSLPGTTDCDTCHDSAYQSAQNWAPNVPNHVTLGFPTSLCSTCHDTISFVDGKFDHSTTGWPLQGPHTLPPHPTPPPGVLVLGGLVVGCFSCHGTTWQPFTAAQTDCYYCHQSYFTTAQNYPGGFDHVAAGVPTTCVLCHTTWPTTYWQQAIFAHPNFKIPHQNSVCADCHINRRNYSTFSCLSACHSGNAGHTNLTKGTIQHKGVSGYVRSATTCVNCHKK